MIKKHKWQLIVSSSIILLPIVTGLLMWDALPESIITHWNAKGEADGVSSKAFAIFVPTLILFLAHLLCIVVTMLDKRNKEQSNKVLGMVFWILPVTSLLINGAMYGAALGFDFDIDIIVRIILVLMFLVFGNYMPKCKPNSTIGVKVVWALRNEENWNKTHRFTGRLWVIGGLFLLVTLFVDMQKLGNIFILLLLLMAFAPMLYSYVYYRRQLKEGTVTKEDIVMNPSEKKTTKISVIIGVFILVLAMLLLFIGKFEVVFEETSFTIDANYWADATISYADIDTIEYREWDDPNASAGRTFGYGSFQLLMGEFENEEFGNYTRYSYIGCDPCVVLSVKGRILVINGTDEEQTQEIYNELLNKTGK